MDRPPPWCDGAGMVFAGAIELDPGFVMLILALVALAALAVCLLGGLAAWIVARRRAAIVLGSVTVAVVGLAAAQVTSGEVAVGLGWSAAVLVGLALRGDRPAA